LVKRFNSLDLYGATHLTCGAVTAECY